MPDVFGAGLATTPRVYTRADVEHVRHSLTYTTKPRAPIYAELSTSQGSGRMLLLHAGYGPSATVVSPGGRQDTVERRDATLPAEDDDFARRWGWLKKEFTKAWLSAEGSEQAVSAGRQRERRRGVWQPRSWEHTIEDEEDFERHFDYIHFNPVKHGLVNTPPEWPWSSFHRWVQQGVYPPNWACGPDPPSHLGGMDDTVGE